MSMRIGPGRKTYETTLIWVCVDCMCVHCNGETGENPDREPLNLIAGEDMTAGMLYSEHDRYCTPDIRESDRCDCETVPFSSSACDGCGSPAGERHALTLWREIPACTHTVTVTV